MKILKLAEWKTTGASRRFIISVSGAELWIAERQNAGNKLSN